jgi:hypothetical protein
MEDPDLQPDRGLGPRGYAGGLGGGTERYFTINWIQLAVTWAAFALFILARSFL